MNGLKVVSVVNVNGERVVFDELPKETRLLIAAAILNDYAEQMRQSIKPNEVKAVIT